MFTCKNIIIIVDTHHATPFAFEITLYRIATPRLTTYGLEGVFLFNSICGSRRVPEYFYDMVWWR